MNRLLIALCLALASCGGSSGDEEATSPSAPAALDTTDDIAEAVRCSKEPEALDPFYRGMTGGARCHVEGRLVVFYTFNDTGKRDAFVEADPGGGPNDLHILEDTGDERELGPTWVITVVSGGTLQEPGAAPVIEVGQLVQDRTGGVLAELP